MTRNPNRRCSCSHPRHQTFHSTVVSVAAASLTEILRGKAASPGTEARPPAMGAEAPAARGPLPGSSCAPTRTTLWPLPQLSSPTPAGAPRMCNPATALRPKMGQPHQGRRYPRMHQGGTRATTSNLVGRMSAEPGRIGARSRGRSPVCTEMTTRLAGGGRNAGDLPRGGPRARSCCMQTGRWPLRGEA